MLVKFANIQFSRIFFLYPCAELHNAITQFSNEEFMTVEIFTSHSTLADRHKHKHTHFVHFLLIFISGCYQHQPSPWPATHAFFQNIGRTAKLTYMKLDKRNEKFSPIFRLKYFNSNVLTI